MLRENCAAPDRNARATRDEWPVPHHILPQAPGNTQHARAGSQTLLRSPPIVPEHILELLTASESVSPPPDVRVAGPGSYPPSTPCRRARPSQDQTWCRIRPLPLPTCNLP